MQTFISCRRITTHYSSLSLHNNIHVRLWTFQKLFERNTSDILEANHLLGISEFGKKKGGGLLYPFGACKQRPSKSRVNTATPFSSVWCTCRRHSQGIFPQIMHINTWHIAVAFNYTTFTSINSCFQQETSELYSECPFDNYSSILYLSGILNCHQSTKKCLSL